MTASEGAIAIVGATGALGFGLALRLGQAGAEVIVGSRDEERARAAAARATTVAATGSFRGAANPDAVGQSEIVVLAVPFASHAATIKGLAEALRPGQLVIDATVPLAPAIGGRPTRLVGVWQGSAAEQTRELLPDEVPVVAAFHTISAAMLEQLDVGLDEDVLICGDRRDDRRRAAELIARVKGLRPVDAGPLEAARIVESLTALLIGVNRRYGTHAGVRITGLPRDGAWPGK
ncbi:MAG TPA: NADPH-dependent F420 reductase [Solirubrobacteraceae bacterium]